MSVLQLVLWLAGSIVVGLVVAWALNALTDWDHVIELDESDPDQVDQQGRGGE
jgi:hypothetical protein